MLLSPSIYLSGNKGLPAAFRQRIANSAGRVQLLFKSIAAHYPKKPQREPSVALLAVPASALFNEIESLRQRIAAVESQLSEERKTSERLRAGFRAALVAHEQVVEAQKLLLKTNSHALKRVREDIVDPAPDVMLEQRGDARKRQKNNDGR